MESTPDGGEQDTGSRLEDIDIECVQAAVSTNECVRVGASTGSLQFNDQTQTTKIRKNPLLCPKDIRGTTGMT